MSTLKKSIDDIHRQMRFNCGSNWNNILTTNCYAYALGIDINEDDIISKAYQPGTIGTTIFNKKIDNLSLEEKINLDLKALNINYNECSQSELSDYYFDNDNIVYNWVIALLLNDNNEYHFLRKSWDNNWWHKRGYNLENPIDYDDNYNTIEDVDKCIIDDYKYIKCLKLSYKEKWN